MPGGKDVTVAVQALDGTWETLGVDRVRGVWPENVSLSADAWGPSAASFDLHRDPAAPWPDVGAFTPVDIWVGGVKCWAGRVKETPARDGQDRVLSVQCEGWQYHLDDDVYPQIYVHDSTTGFQDARSHPDTSLSSFRATGNVSTDSGITLLWPNGERVQNNQFLGAYIDTGIPDAIKRVVLTVDWFGGSDTAYSFYVRSSNSVANMVTDANTLIGPISHPGPSTTAYVGSAPNKGRYVLLFLNYTGTTAAVGSDVGIRIRDFRAFGDDAYESGNLSVLRAETVIADAISHAPILSTDTSQTDPNNTDVFNIPASASIEPRTPRAWIQGVNAYHGWTTAVDVERRMVFRELESAPRWEVGQWSGMEFEDASANSGEDIYNRVVVTGQTPIGDPLSVQRFARGPADLSINQPANPSATVDATGWSILPGNGGSISRTTTAGQYDSAPAGFKYSYATGMEFECSSVSQTFAVGQRYYARAWIKASSTNLDNYTFYIKVNGTMVASKQVSDSNVTVAQVVEIEWVQATAGTSYVVGIFGAVTGGGFDLYWDSVEVGKPATTLPDRRKFLRTMILPISTALPSDGIAAGQIGSTWLNAHKTTPFRGSVSLTGDALRDVLTGQSVGLERMLLAPQALIRFSDRIDPDTGAHGRDGRIATVTYTPATDTASVAIDSTRSQLDVLLSRLAVISGG